MKKKGTIGIVATLGIGLCAYALSQQPQVKEEKKNQIQYLQAEKKASSTDTSKKEDSIKWNLAAVVMKMIPMRSDKAFIRNLDDNLLRLRLFLGIDCLDAIFLFARGSR